MQMKINFLTNIPSPYRVIFFNHLATKSDLLVIYERISSVKRNKDWFSSKINHKHLCLKGIPLGTESVLSFNLIKLLKRIQSEQIFIIGGYTTISGLISILFSYFRKVPIVINFDGIKSQNSNLFVRAIKRILLSRKFFYLVPNSVTENYLMTLGINGKMIFRYRFSSFYQNDLLPRNDLITIKEKKQHFFFDSNMRKLRVITVSRFDYDKGFDIFIKIAEMNPQHDFVFIGELPSSKYVNYLKENKVNNLEFLGFLNKEKLVEEFLTSDTYLTTSRVDPWNLSVVEAMSLMLPIISTPEVGSTSELIKNGFNGAIINHNDLEGFKEQLSFYSSNYRALFQHSINAYDSSIPYTFENMAEDHLIAFKKIRKIHFARQT